MDLHDSEAVLRAGLATLPIAPDGAADVSCHASFRTLAEAAARAGQSDFTREMLERSRSRTSQWIACCCDCARLLREDAASAGDILESALACIAECSEDPRADADRGGMDTLEELDALAEVVCAAGDLEPIGTHARDALRAEVRQSADWVLGRLEDAPDSLYRSEILWRVVRTALRGGAIDVVPDACRTLTTEIYGTTRTLGANDQQRLHRVELLVELGHLAAAAETAADARDPQARALAHLLVAGGAEHRDGYPVRSEQLAHADRALEHEPSRLLTRDRLRPTADIRHDRRSLVEWRLVLVEIAHAYDRLGCRAESLSALGRVHDATGYPSLQGPSDGVTTLAGLLVAQIDLRDERSRETADRLAAALLEDLGRGAGWEIEHHLHPLWRMGSAKAERVLAYLREHAWDAALGRVPPAARAPLPLTVPGSPRFVRTAPLEAHSAYAAMVDGHPDQAADHVRELLRPERIAKERCPDTARVWAAALLIQTGAVNEASRILAEVPDLAAAVPVRGGEALQALGWALLETGQARYVLDQIPFERSMHEPWDLAVALEWALADGPAFDRARARMESLGRPPAARFGTETPAHWFHHVRCLARAGRPEQARRLLDELSGSEDSMLSDESGLPAIELELAAAIGGVEAVLRGPHRHTLDRRSDGWFDALAARCRTCADVEALLAVCDPRGTRAGAAHQLIELYECARARRISPPPSLVERLRETLAQLRSDRDRGRYAERVVTAELDSGGDAGIALEWLATRIQDPERRLSLLPRIAHAASAQARDDLLPRLAELSRQAMNEALPRLRVSVLSRHPDSDGEGVHTKERMGDPEPAALVDHADVLRIAGSQSEARKACHTALERLVRPRSGPGSVVVEYLDRTTGERGGSRWDKPLRAYALIQAKLGNSQAAAAVAATIVDQTERMKAFADVAIEVSGCEPRPVVLGRGVVSRLSATIDIGRS